MALPQFRYIWARLSPLAHPGVLATGLFALLAAMFALEFARNPNWYRAYDPDEEDANGELVSSELTPEEQAQVAEIDNLSFLTNTVGNESAESDGQSEQVTLLQELLGSTTIDSDATNSDENTLNRYLESYAALELDSVDPSTNIYRNLFNASSGSEAGNNTSQLNVTGQTQASESSGSSVINSNPLAQALQALILGGGDATNTEAQAAEGTGAEGAEGGDLTAGESQLADPFGLNGALRPVTLPAIPGTFLPTTPDMSPPLGTTGYTPPASLPLIPPLSNNLDNAFTNLGIPNVPAGAGLPPAANSTIDLSAPPVNNGVVSPLSNTVTPSPSVNSQTLTPSPFAVQGVPGSYTGGGYINTFSNPGQAPAQ